MKYFLSLAVSGLMLVPVLAAGPTPDAAFTGWTAAGPDQKPQDTADDKKDKTGQPKKTDDDQKDKSGKPDKDAKKKDGVDNEKDDHGQSKKDENTPHLGRTLKELRLARNHLDNAKHDFGGHREAALKAIDEAIKQIELAMKNDPDSKDGKDPNSDAKDKKKDDDSGKDKKKDDSPGKGKDKKK